MQTSQTYLQKELVNIIGTCTVFEFPQPQPFYSLMETTLEIIIDVKINLNAHFDVPSLNEAVKERLFNLQLTVKLFDG